MSKFQTFLNKPSQTLNDAQATTKPAFKLKDASVPGGDMLISDPRKWSELEDEYLAANLR